MSPKPCVRSQDRQAPHPCLPSHSLFPIHDTPHRAVGKHLVLSVGITVLSHSTLFASQLSDTFAIFLSFASSSFRAFGRGPLLETEAGRLEHEGLLNPPFGVTVLHMAGNTVTEHVLQPMRLGCVPKPVSFGDVWLVVVGLYRRDDKTRQTILWSASPLSRAGRTMFPKRINSLPPG